MIDLGVLLMVDARARGLYGYFSGRSFVIENDGDLSDTREGDENIRMLEIACAHRSRKKNIYAALGRRIVCSRITMRRFTLSCRARRVPFFFYAHCARESGLHPFKSPALPFFGCCCASNLLRLVFVTFGYLKL